MTVPFLDDAALDADETPAALPSGGLDEEDAVPQDPSGMDGGWWLTEPDGRAVRQAVRDEWKRQDSIAKRRAAKTRASELLRAGVRGVQVVPDEDEDSFTVRAPLSGEHSQRAPGKSDGLIRRIAATLTVDMPAPDVTPNSDDDDEQQAAQLAERLLKVEGAPSQRDDATMLRGSIDRAGTYASVFRYGYIDPRAQLVPLEIRATRDAQTVEDALFVTIPAPMDPVTGMPMGEPQRVPSPPDQLINRYVTIDGGLTDVAADARLTWQAEWREHTVLPSQVRLLPAIGPTHVDDALGVIVSEVTTLGEVINRYYDGERPAEETVKKLVDWKPAGWKDWLPRAMRETLDTKIPTRPDGTVLDTALVALQCLYWRQSHIAPFGAYVCIGGLPEPVARGEWRVTLGDGPDAQVVALPLPVAQMRWREDTEGGDPMGIAAMEDLAPAEEIRSAALRYALDYMYRFGKPWAFLPFGTTITPEQIANRDPVYVGPEGTPFFEPLPNFAPVVQQLYADMGNELQADSGLNDATATGKAPGNVTSGKQMQELVEQSLVALAGLQQNAARFVCRVWANRLAFMRAYYDTPRVLDYLGEGGDTQRRAWMGVDLVGAGDLQIARGTGTMLPRSAKAQLAREELQLAQATGDALGAQRYYKAILGNTTPLMGLQDDPHRARMTRQLRAWRDGAFAPSANDPAGDAPQDPAQIFQPNPTDVIPGVAQMRFAELSDALSGKQFPAANPAYQQVLVAEFERMRQAAGVMTLQEQQQAQQMAAQQQQQAEAQKEGAKVQAQTQQKLQLKAADAEIDDRARQLDLQREALSAAGGMVTGQSYPNPDMA